MSRTNVVSIPRPRIRLKKRAFQTAKATMLASTWPVQSQPIDADVRRGLKALRARCRDEAQNNDHMRAFLRAVRTNVIGPQGVRYQCMAKLANGKPDRRARDAVEMHFAEWGRRGCEVTGELTWRDEQRRAVETLARDGEAVYRKVYGWDGNPYRFALQAIDPEVLDVDLNADLGNGSVIVMGIELDVWRRPVAYHLLPDNRSAQFYGYRQGSHIRLPADEVIHLKLPEWIWQTRGIPWATTALLRMRMLSGYEDAVLTAARAGASKMGFYEQDPDADPQLDDSGEPTGAIGEGETPQGELIEEFSPAHMGVLPPGYKFTGFDPGFPDGNHGPFIAAALRGIASGLGVSYNAFANDYDGVNYSSLRQAALNERDVWMCLQDYVIGAFHAEVQRAWLETSLVVGAIRPDRGEPYDIGRLLRLCRCSWGPRRWQWVDPQKEAAGAEKELGMRLVSVSQLIRERGRDPDETWEELAEDQARLEALGITVPALTGQPATPAQPPVDDEDEEGEDDA